MRTNAIITASSLPAVALFTHRTCNQITPYRAGFEDVLYDHEYANPYDPNTDAYNEYEWGVQDANRQRRGERLL